MAASQAPKVKSYHQIGAIIHNHQSVADWLKERLTERLHMIKEVVTDKKGKGDKENSGKERGTNQKRELKETITVNKRNYKIGGDLERGKEGQNEAVRKNRPQTETPRGQKL